MGTVYLVGAGPGDPQLITRKGFGLLQECDAVVYDRLASEELLDTVRPDCRKIYVGKQPGIHSKKQEEINQILVECAQTYGTVVRLKGGDPFVFGRGGEEIETLQQYGIAYEVVPGVTSAIAVPECAGIPVTHRGVSRSFHVITGHTKDAQGRPECDYEVLAKTEGTLIFLMGMSNLKEIADNLIQAGKTADTPAAVIAEGTTGRQRAVRGTLGTIAEKVRESALSSPAVIVIGETAGYDLKYTKENGKKIGITATHALRGKLEKGFAQTGAEVFTVCDMKLCITKELQKLDEELDRLHSYQWVLFTSQNGVRIFFEELAKKQMDIRRLGPIKFAVLGSGTQEKLLEYGLIADFLPSRYMVSVLAEEFSKVIGKKERVLIPRAVQGSEILTEILDRNQIAYTDIPIYDVEGELTENIRFLDELDCLVFVSASGAKEFFAHLRRENLSLPAKIKIACIGKITQNMVQQEYGDADIIAWTNNVEGLVDAVNHYYDRES